MRKSLTRTGARPCRAAAAMAATAAIIVATTATAATAATPANTTLTANVTQVATQGGTPVILTGGASTLSGATDVPYRVWMTTAAACTSAYPTAGTAWVLASSSATLSGETLSFASPPVAAGVWRFCAYDSNATAVLAGTSSTVLAVPFGTLNTATGPAGGTNVLTLTAPGVFTGTSYSTEFNTNAAGCPSTYAAISSPSVISATTTKASVNALSITVPTAVTAATGYYVCVYGGTTPNSSPILARTGNTYGAYATTLPTMTIAPPNGSSGVSGTNVTLTTTAGTVPIPNTAALGVIFTRNTCPTTNIAASTADLFKSTNVARISNAKVAASVPTTVVSGARDATTPWNVCLYSEGDTTGTLITQPITYMVAPVLSVSGVLNTAGYDIGGLNGGAGPASITPTSGAAQGGTDVTIRNLSGIPTADGALLQASLGGSPLTAVRATSSTSITGTTSGHAPGMTNLSVTTAAGTRTTTFTLVGGTTGAGAFTYAYGINVTPNTAAPVTAGTTVGLPTLDIMGAGFSNLDFEDIPLGGSATSNTKAHVLLVNNAWYAQTASGANLTTGAGLANPFNVNSTTVTVTPTTQCKAVLPIGDNELICTLDLGHTITGNASYAAVALNAAAAVPTGTYTITVINSGGSPTLLNTSYNYSVVSSGSTFTVATF